MKLKQIFKNICGIAMLWTMSINLNAQVTIGSDEKPIGGALLQLKNLTGISGEAANATKGLGMPRVTLTTLNELTDIGIGLSKEEHTGLCIYHVVEDPLCPLSPSGLHVWDGKKWQSAMLPSNEMEVDRLIDERVGALPEKYRVGNFGAAGWWMLENLRADRWPDGTTTGLSLSNPNPSNHTPNYYYPNNDVNILYTHPEYGYTYNWEAATRDRDPLAQLPEEGNSTHTMVQGICPNGWYLPRDYDWNLLEKEIATNPTVYSNYEGTMWSDGPGQGGLPDSNWATAAAARPESGPGHGKSMKSCTVVNGIKSIGASKRKGFEVLLVGTTLHGVAQYYGELALFWTSSNQGAGDAYRRTLSIYGESVGRVGASRYAQYSIRCFKPQ